MRSSTLVADRVPVSVVSAMEDRKRAIPHDSSDDPSPPLKRQAVTPASSSTNHLVPQSQEDVIHFQKEAIFRQMLEYKRERNLLENRLEQLDKKATYHDDHIRIMDVWWISFWMKFGFSQAVPRKVERCIRMEFRTSFLRHYFLIMLLVFSEHLAGKRDHIISNLNSLFKALKTSSNNPTSEKLADMQARLGKLLAAEKAYLAQIERLEKEKEEATSQLTTATIKYMTAEKKMDRLKSQSLAKIERQAMFNSSSNQEVKRESSCPDASTKDRETDSRLEGHTDADQARKEAQAIASKQKEEIQKLQADNTRLSEQVTNFTIKFGRLSEEDISNCDVHKNLKVKLEDIVNRFNHIEAENNNLRKAAEKFEAERTEFKEQILNEQRSTIQELQTQLARVEQDLARVRAARDDLIQDQSMRKAKEEHRTGATKANELAEIQASQISALEAEVERLRIELGQNTESNLFDSEASKLSREELLEKFIQLEKAYKALSHELPPLESAFKKAKEVTMQKIKELEEKEPSVNRLIAEKGKAEQKFFAAMKTKEILQQENRVLKNQNAKSSEIIAQLKDAEKSVTHLVSNLEKQLAEMKVIQNTLVTKNREQETKLTEHTNTIDSYKRQVGELANALKVKDASFAKESSSRREAEIELEKLQVRLDEVTRTLEAERSKGSENSQLEALRSIALCSVCKSRWKDTAIRSCGHVFCKQCAEERITLRSRKCPTCARAFAATDIIPVYLGV
ncbi:BRE1 E3 ubiquitin ligase-domain-containing protein [Kalaharituber pfeilii]|nr:BRE1 E3 ubiquitin ligase-domain-containing protein [Kalaharituber pfeilii]